MDISQMPYSQSRQEELILRDYLAAQRTVLANDRTVLAFLRTTLTFLIGGVSFIQFFHSPFVRAMGWTFLPLALIVLLIGFVKYVRMKSALARITKLGAHTSPPALPEPPGAARG